MSEPEDRPVGRRSCSCPENEYHNESTCELGWEEARYRNHQFEDMSTDWFGWHGFSITIPLENVSWELLKLLTGKPHFMGSCPSQWPRWFA